MIAPPVVSNERKTEMTGFRILTGFRTLAGDFGRHRHNPELWISAIA